MLNRDELKNTEEWQALNAIWKAMPKEGQTLTGEQFKLLTEFIRTNAKPKKDTAKEDAAYLDALSEETQEALQKLYAAGEPNLYQVMMQFIGKGQLGSSEEVMKVFSMLYWSRKPWLAEQQDAIVELIELCWARLLERGFVPGEGMPKR